jgi:hypothetical protein
MIAKLLALLCIQNSKCDAPSPNVLTLVNLDIAVYLPNKERRATEAYGARHES